MSKAATNVGCPHCGASSVELSGDGNEQITESSRLKGSAHNCRNCGDEFEIYFY